MIWTLIWINVIITLIFDSGFVDSVDSFINKRIPLHHLPKPFSCPLCMTFWCSIIAIIITHHFTIPYIGLSLINAHLQDITHNVFIVFKDGLNKAITLIHKILN